MISINEVKQLFVNMDTDARIWAVVDRECVLCKIDELEGDTGIDHIDIDSYCDGWIKGMTFYINPHFKGYIMELVRSQKKIREKL